MIDPVSMMMLGQAIGGGVPALAQAGLGVYQGIKAAKMQKNLKDPVYEVPNSIDKGIAMFADRANTNTMVGYDNAVQKLDQGMANTTNDILTAAGSGGDALGALVKANASNQGAMNDLAIQNAKAVDSYDVDLMNAIMGRAEYEDKAFQINVLDKFNRDAAAVSAMKNAAIQNTFGGIKGLSKTAGDVMATKAGQKQGLLNGGSAFGKAGDSGINSGANPNANLTTDIIGAAAVPQTSTTARTGIGNQISPETLQALIDAQLYDMIGGDVSMKPYKN